MIRLKQKKKKKYKQLLCSVVLLALTLFVFGFAADRIRLSNESEQTTILEKAVTRTITQCYALEGSYRLLLCNGRHLSRKSGRPESALWSDL